MSAIGTKIKDQKNIFDTTRRIAYQILESNNSEEEIIIAGITKNGAILAKNLCTLLNSICSSKFRKSRKFVRVSFYDLQSVTKTTVTDLVLWHRH